MMFFSVNFQLCVCISVACLILFGLYWNDILWVSVNCAHDKRDSDSDN